MGNTYTKRNRTQKTQEMIPPESEALRTWASEWADKFDQSFTEEKVRSYVGKRVIAATAERGGPQFNVVVIGFSIDTLVLGVGDEVEEVHRFSLISDEGVQVALLAGMKVTAQDS